MEKYQQQRRNQEELRKSAAAANIAAVIASTSRPLQGHLETQPNQAIVTTKELPQNFGAQNPRAPGIPIPGQRRTRGKSTAGLNGFMRQSAMFGTVEDNEEGCQIVPPKKKLKIKGNTNREEEPIQAPMFYKSPAEEAKKENTPLAIKSRALSNEEPSKGTKAEHGKNLALRECETRRITSYPEGGNRPDDLIKKWEGGLFQQRDDANQWRKMSGNIISASLQRADQEVKAIRAKELEEIQRAKKKKKEEEEFESNWDEEESMGKNKQIEFEMNWDEEESVVLGKAKQKAHASIQRNVERKRDDAPVKVEVKLEEPIEEWD